MRRVLTLIGLLSCLPAMGIEHSQDTVPAFEAAEIRVGVANAFQAVSGPIIRGARYEINSATMVDLIALAYDVKPDFVYGGPTWMERDRFSVIAKLPAETSPEKARLMLKGLLADRFNLAVHPDNKAVSVFVLSPGKGKAKLRQSAGGPWTCRMTRAPGGSGSGASGADGYIEYACQNLTSANLAQTLSRLAADYLNRAVIDDTGLDGAWDFDLKWTPRNQLPGAGADGISISDAVDKQLGLKLELVNHPAPVIAIDGVNEKPTDNAPGIAASIPEFPKEFEVADIKPSAPDSTGSHMNVQAGGRLDAEGSLRDLLVLGMDLPLNIAGDLIAGAPPFLDLARFVIIAKAPVVGGPETVPPIAELRVMLLTLLKDRFNLTTYVESREIPVYALIAPRTETKLRKADPSARGSCKLDVAAGKAIGTPGAYLCQNTTMPELAQLLQQRANAYMNHPVVDRTGIAGGWDFSIGWMPKGQLQSVEAGGLTVFEGVEKQLGLKLDLQKQAFPVTVIDHIDPRPRE